MLPEPLCMGTILSQTSLPLPAFPKLSSLWFPLSNTGYKNSENEGAEYELYNHDCLPKGLKAAQGLKVIMQSPRGEKMV